jgi:1,4-dihydroxy-2-naphthoate octaprenyltransferase
METKLPFSMTLTPSKLRAWFILHKLPKHPATLFPFLLGTAIAYWHTDIFALDIFIVALLALFSVTNACHISNEYFDYESDQLNAGRIGGDERVGVTTTGGVRVLVKGIIAKEQALAASLIWAAVAVLLWLWLYFGFETGPLTLPLGAVALFIGWFYTAPPVRAVYRGLGELFIAIALTLDVFFGYYIQSGASLLPFLVALPWTVATPALKILREFPDQESDAASAKRTLTVIFGRERMAPIYAGMISLAILLFIPIYFLVQSVSYVLVLVPIYFLMRSVWPFFTGEWRTRATLEASANHGFIGMLLIPFSLTFVFLLPALF